MSPHQTIAENLRLALVSAGLFPSGWKIERRYGVKDLLGATKAEQDEDSDDEFSGDRIVFMVSEVADERVGKVNDSDVTITVVVFKRLEDDSTTLAQMDAADAVSEELRVWLRTQARISFNDSDHKATRINTTLTTPWSSELSRQADLFVSVIQTVYRVGR